MEIVMEALNLLGVDEAGLNQSDRKILEALLNKFGGGPVGLGTLSASLSEEEATIEEFNEQMHTNFSDETYDTIGGIVMNSFGYLPKRGETITINNLEFKIINADARRIKLLECIDKRPADTSKIKAEG
jgi:CBS domain containing-hemolysin-like protein